MVQKLWDQLPMNVGDRHYDPLFPFNFGLKTNSAPDFRGEVNLIWNYWEAICIRSDDFCDFQFMFHRLNPHVVSYRQEGGFKSNEHDLFAD
ncbi:hypothetical protein OIU79_005401 [Salix purpurea]|uniref:Uncharacterized protein n=1 Tax=Salix purpurea TaxID=77065 RepID=A0A9Q0UCH3_SALPP|nr:hypothetical protein OIU79_005401 [Salix purpurea]